MTEMIVALDGHSPFATMCRLYDDAGVRWFKIGPQSMCYGLFDDMLRMREDGCRTDAKIFLDLKLADTEDTCREAVKRFAGAGVAAVSAFTDRAGIAAVDAAEGTDLRVWRVWMLTDGEGKPGFSYPGDLHGIICPVAAIRQMRLNYSEATLICPGIRMGGTDPNGHKRSAADPHEAAAERADYIVVGRPIWQAPDPVRAAKQFLAALTTPP